MQLPMATWSTLISPMLLTPVSYTHLDVYKRQASDALLDLVAVIFLAQYVKFGKTLMTMK